jgi:hypothetical protein
MGQEQRILLRGQRRREGKGERTRAWDGGSSIPAKRHSKEGTSSAVPKQRVVEEGKLTQRTPLHAAQTDETPNERRERQQLMS